MNQYTYGHLIFDKGAKKYSVENNRIFNKWSACIRMQIYAFLPSWTMFKSKWIKELHIKPGTLKEIEQKVGKTLVYIGAGENFLNRTSLAYSLRSRINKWYFKKLKFLKV